VFNKRTIGTVGYYSGINSWCKDEESKKKAALLKRLGD